MFKDQKIKNFLDTLASKSPTPGGGSAAALTAAMSSALVSMVGNLTLGKEEYSAVEEDIKKILGKSEKLRDEFENLIEEDIQVFNQFMAVLKLPKDTSLKKEYRKKKIQEALFEAANVPLMVAGKCNDLLDICLEIARLGTKNVISDAGVGGVFARAAFDSALLNVKVNLGMMKDEKKRNDIISEMNTLNGLIDAKKEKILQIVSEKI